MQCSEGPVTVEFSSFDTERAFDYVFFDGDDSVFDRTSGSDRALSGVVSHSWTRVTAR